MKRPQRRKLDKSTLRHKRTKTDFSALINSTRAVVSQEDPKGHMILLDGSFNDSEPLTI
jgi:hypothetical protein